MTRLRLVPMCLAWALAVMGALAPGGADLYAQTARDIRLIYQLGQADARDRQYLKDLQDPAKRTALLKQLLSGYDQQLGRSFNALAAGKKQAARQKYIADLRAKALAVIDRPDLSKTMIQEELDPLFAELEQLLMPGRSDLLAADQSLRRLRLKLQQARVDEARLQQIEKDWLQRTLAQDAAQLKVLVDNAALLEAGKVDLEEYRGIAETNRRRMILGLAPLAIDPQLVACGRDHARDMVEKDFFSHTSPVPGKTTPWDRAKRFNTSANGENIAAGYPTGQAAVMGWWYSPGHLKNMMTRRAGRIGLGRFGKHWTQMFGR